ncbi:hypothetical protein DZC78_04120 [Olleya aquimaris]|nr:hypothetical protein DZC78_04120 [Olleya aquimaris]
MNYIKKTDAYDIYIEPSRKTIVIRQKWKYIWSVASGLPNWSYLEKKAWHQKADNVIWQQWGDKYVFQTFVESTNTDQSLHKKKFKVEFDIQWVTSNQHWTANIIKVKPHQRYRSYVSRNAKTINLASIDLKTRVSGDINQNTLKHEFGHTISILDEYSKEYGNKRLSMWVDDTKALMNIGNELRQRYIKGVKKELNTIIPGVYFIGSLN